MLEDDKITTNTELHMKDSKNKNYSSRIPGFAKLNFKERVEVLLDRGILSQNDIHTLKKSGALPKVLSESLIENSIGTFETFGSALSLLLPFPFAFVIAILQLLWQHSTRSLLRGQMQFFC